MASFFGTKIDPHDHHRSQIKFYLILIPLAVLMILPILFIFNHAFKPQNELFAFPPRFFVREPTLDNFIELGRVASQGSIPLSRYILNSLLVPDPVLISFFISSFETFLATSRISLIRLDLPLGST
jgi:ABC-type glycerol-3-phosphate transport system permease component